MAGRTRADPDGNAQEAVDATDLLGGRRGERGEGEDAMPVDTDAPPAEAERDCDASDGRVVVVTAQRVLATSAER